MQTLFIHLGYVLNFQQEVLGAPGSGDVEAVAICAAGAWWYKRFIATYTASLVGSKGPGSGGGYVRVSGDLGGSISHIFRGTSATAPTPESTFSRTADICLQMP